MYRGRKLSIAGEISDFCRRNIASFLTFDFPLCSRCPVPVDARKNSGDDCQEERDLTFTIFNRKIEEYQVTYIFQTARKSSFSSISIRIKPSRQIFSIVRPIDAILTRDYVIKRGNKGNKYISTRFAGERSKEPDRKLSSKRILRAGNNPPRENPGNCPMIEVTRSSHEDRGEASNNGNREREDSLPVPRRSAIRCFRRGDRSHGNETFEETNEVVSAYPAQDANNNKARDKRP